LSGESEHKGLTRQNLGPGEAVLTNENTVSQSGPAETCTTVKNSIKKSLQDLDALEHSKQRAERKNRHLGRGLMTGENLPAEKTKVHWRPRLGTGTQEQEVNPGAAENQSCKNEDRQKELARKPG
jgi:hypothetical protein